MRNLFIILPLAALLFIFSSCDKDTYRHSIQVTYPAISGVIYADQEEDSIIFTTFDSYTVSTYNTPWITVKDSKDHPSSAKIPNSYYNCYLVKVFLGVEANTTGKSRTGYVQVRSYGEDDWDQTGAAVYMQTGWHNIEKPSPKYEYDNNNLVTTATFSVKDSATQIVDTLRFMAYSDWVIDDPDGVPFFVKPAYHSGGKGYHTILLTVEPNPSVHQRKIIYHLRSANGVITPIEFIQEGKKEEK